MLFHDRGTVNIADVVRYIVTYDPSLDHGNKHGILSHISSATHTGNMFSSKIHLRIRNNASMLLRAAYLQGPYVLAVSVRDDKFHADDESEEIPSSAAPVYDHDLKASTSFWTELPCDKKYLFQASFLTLDGHGLLRSHLKPFLQTRQRHSRYPLAIQRRVLAKQHTQMT
jgi:hypothetical protein